MPWTRCVPSIRFPLCQIAVNVLLRDYPEGTGAVTNAEIRLIRPAEWFHLICTIETWRYAALNLLG